MLVSHLFTRHKTPAPRFAPGLFLGLMLSFVVLGQSRPAFGLVGLGTVLITSGSLIILNRERIWENYKKTYKKRGLKGLWTKPNPIYYTINIVFLWPFIIFLGFVCLAAAYMVGY